MKKYIIGIILGVAVALPLAVFAGEIRSGIKVDGYIRFEKMSGVAERFVDEENGIVCWVVDGFSGQTNGISCVKK